MIIAVTDATCAVAKRKPEKNSGLHGTRTLDLCYTGAALLPVVKVAPLGPDQSERSKIFLDQSESSI